MGLSMGLSGARGGIGGARMKAQARQHGTYITSPSLFVW